MNEFVIDNKETLICKICGNTFLSNRMKMSHVKKEHGLSSENYIIKVYYNNNHPTCMCGCGKKLTFTNKKRGFFFKNYTQFHDKNRINKIKETKRKKYGDENYCNIEKIKRTKKEKYGDENYTNRDKAKQTCLNKYGVDSFSKTIEFKEIMEQRRYEGNFDNVGIKLKKTKKEKYGNEGYNNIDKIKQTNLEKYGVENVHQFSEIVKKAEQTIFDKYGVKSIFQRKDVIKNRKKSSIKKYGVDSPIKSLDVRNKSKQKLFNKLYYKITHDKNFIDVIDVLFLIKDYKGVKNQKYKFRCKKCNIIFKDTLDNGKVPRCLKCYPIINGRSNMEREIYDYIDSIYYGKIIKNNKKLFSGKYELDIYIPDKKIAIEFDGLYWHSELQGKNKNYHLNKTIKCEEKGIRLIHIFEDEWINKQEIVKNKLKNLLGLSTEKIYARKCKIRELLSGEKLYFLEKYHIQGNDKSLIKLGLFYENEIIAVMTFGKRRLALGKKNSEDGEYELLRYATSCSVIGGAGKLLSYFIKNYQPKKIVSYADRRWSQGNLYEKLGFQKIGETPINYWYIINQQRLHRFNFRKNILNEKLKDFDPNLTEWQNMQINGYDRIWDCGSLKYEKII